MTDDLRAYYATATIPKTYREKKTPQPIRRKSKSLSERTHIADVRAYIIGRERNVCRCCRIRVGQSMHELRPRSLGGKVSRKNSVWLCGAGVNGCHGFIQRYEIVVHCDVLGAESLLMFTPESPSAADWMKIQKGITIHSEPMHVMESAE